jgi:hypothetical protein
MNVIVVSLSRMPRSRILPVGAAVAAVALSATPGLAAAATGKDHDQNDSVGLPLLALPGSSHVVSPAGHSSHSSHASHSSHVSGAHSSHASHLSHHSHFSSSPVSPPSSPTPSPTPTASPTPAHHPGHHKRHHRRRHHKRPQGSAIRSSPSPSDITSTPIPTISQVAVSNNSSDSGGGSTALGVVGIVVIGGVTLYITKRKRRAR